MSVDAEEEYGPITIDLLANDTGAFTMVELGTPTNGDVVDNGGIYEYTPYPGTGDVTDSFQYTLIDEMTGASSTATVYITITGNNNNNGPVAVDDTVTINGNETVAIHVLQNDYDPFGGQLTVTDVTSATMGSVTLDPSLNTLVYTPDPNQVGTDSFQYTITNDSGMTATATVTVTMETVNTPPVFEEMVEFDTGEIEIAASDNIFEDGMVLGQLQAIDADGDQLEYHLDGYSDYIDVLIDGTVEVTNSTGLNAFFASGGTGLNIGVRVSDGTTSILSQFVLAKKNSWVDQSEIYLEASNGTVYTPDTATKLLENMNTIKENGEQIKQLIIKGHGGEGIIEVGDGGESLYLNGSGAEIFIGNTTVTQLLKDITDGSTTIRFRGCFTYSLAKDVERILDGAKVVGAVRFVIGIPGTPWGLGVYR